MNQMKVRTIRVVFQVAGANYTDIDKFLAQLAPAVRYMGNSRLLVGEVLVESEIEVTA